MRAGLRAGLHFQIAHWIKRVGALAALGQGGASLPVWNAILVPAYSWPLTPPLPAFVLLALSYVLPRLRCPAQR